MDRFIIIAPHTLEGCTKTLQQVEAMGYLTHFDWGCKDGEHCGWTIIEAENAKQALMVVPSADRPLAKAIKLNKFAPTDVHRSH